MLRGQAALLRRDPEAVRVVEEEFERMKERRARRDREGWED